MKNKNYFAEKKIIIFGAGNVARVFCADFKNILNITCCISNNPTEKSIQITEDFSLDVYGVNERLKEYDNELIVLCADAHDEMEEQLFYMGYRYGVHYIDSGMFRCLISDKKLAFVYGVCYMRAIHDCLKKSEAFTKEYDIYFKLSYKEMKPHEFDSFSYILTCADLYIYNSVLTSRERIKNAAIIDKLPEDCRVISVPIISFAGYHPQTLDNHGTDNQYCIVSKKTDWSPFLSPDCNINKFIDAKVSTSEIIKRISSPDFYEKDFLEKNYKYELTKLQIAESASDVKILDFVKDNKGKIRLFYNESHISNEVIIELTKRILILLEIDVSLPEYELLDSELLHTSEVPIYPSVICELMLENYSEKDVHYKLFSFNGFKSVSFEEYIEYYCDFCRNMREQIVLGFFPR